MKNNLFNEVENVISSTECTGLMPALPVDDPEANESAARLYAIHAPQRRKDKKCAKKAPKRH